MAGETLFLPERGIPLDPSFEAQADYEVLSLAMQADGRILVGGLFNSLGGQPRSCLGRLYADGSLDLTFTATADYMVCCLAVQGDGKILVGGQFNSLCGQPRSSIGRLNADGSLDASFNPPGTRDYVSHYVYSLMLQSDGKILVGGGFTKLAGQPRNYIARLKSDGSIDSAFNPGANNQVTCLAVQADGKILVGGAFTSLGGSPRKGIGRLNLDGAIDPSFDLRSSSGDNIYVSCMALQADGKILIGGTFTYLGGQTRFNLGRLNTDGNLDSSFNPGANRSVSSLALQVDGKIIVGGSFTTLAGQTRYCLGRLTADGNLDPTFSVGASEDLVSVVCSLALQCDGKIVVGGYFTSLGGQPRNGLGRLLNTGPASENLSFDGSSFLWQRSGAGPEICRTILEMTTNNLDWISLIAGTRTPDGWLFPVVSAPVGGTFRARGWVASPSSSSWLVDGYWGDYMILAQPRGRTNNAGTLAVLDIVAGGTGPLQYQWFKDGLPLSDGGHVTGAHTATLNLSDALNADQGFYNVVVGSSSGSITSSFARVEVIDPFITSPPTNQVAQGGDTVILKAVTAGTPPLCYQWFKEGVPLPGATNSSLSLADVQPADAGCYSVTVSNRISSVASDPVVLTVNLITSDPTFTPVPLYLSHIFCGAIQPDGKILLAMYTVDGGLVRRLNADGSPDSSFNILTLTDASISSLILQTDGKITVGGYFTNLDGQARNHLARLNSDGHVDSAFNPQLGTSQITCLALQPDGKILAGGIFTNGNSQNGLVRLNPDGSVDSSFTPAINETIWCLALQTDGKILAGFQYLPDEQSPNGLARLNPDGSLDSAFAPTIQGNEFTYPSVYSMVVQADGKILVCGTFTGLCGQECNCIGRLNPDGSMDASFNPGPPPPRSEIDGSSISCMAVQADGKIIVGGCFCMLGGQLRNSIGRLHADGSLDLTFDPFRGAEQMAVSPVVLQPDGKILVSGYFPSDVVFFGRPRPGFITRLNNTGPATQIITYSGSSLFWMRGGTGPEVWRTIFDVTTDGANWTGLGEGARTPGGWVLSGVSLPPHATVRARGFVATGDTANWFVEGFYSSPSRLAICAISADCCSLNLFGNPGETLELQTATDPSDHWLTLNQFLITNSPVAVPWSNHGEEKRFFRVQSR